MGEGEKREGTMGAQAPVKARRRGKGTIKENRVETYEIEDSE